jgi:hypothetical protein
MVPEWDAQFWQRHRGVATLRPGCAWPAWASWPGIDELQGLLDANAVPVVNAAGRALRLSAAHPASSAADYEGRVARDATLGVRLPGWHDVFNVLAWTAWPRSKAALNGRHVAELERHSGPNRSPARDALTGFDEDGVVVCVSDPRLEQLARAMHWKALFWEQRIALAHDFRVFVFGHALAGKLLAPFVGLTAKAVFVRPPPGFDALPVEGQRALLDRQLAGVLGAPGQFATTGELSPLPVLGLPGWWPGGDDPAFYDNTAYFRPARRARVERPGDAP